MASNNRELFETGIYQGVGHTKSCGVVGAEYCIEPCSIGIVGCNQVVHASLGPFGGPSHCCHGFKGNLTGRYNHNAAVKVGLNRIYGTLIEEAGIVVISRSADDFNVHWVSACGQLKFLYEILTLNGSNHIVVKGCVIGDSICFHNQTVIGNYRNALVLGNCQYSSREAPSMEAITRMSAPLRIMFSI